MSSPSAARLRQWNRHRLVLVAVLVCLCGADTYRFLGYMESRQPTLKRWLPYAAELGRDDQLYERHPDYLYPPFFLVLLKPLTWMPAWAAAVLWQVAKYVAILAIFALSWNWVARAGPVPAWARVGPVLVSLRFIVSDLKHGNINLFICLCVVLGGWLLARNRRFACGVLVAAAACVKVTPALWIAYLLYKRQWRAMLGVAVGCGIALEVVPLLVVSPRQNHALLRQWHAHVVASFVAEGKINSERMNQSMAAVTNRLLGRSAWAPGEERVALAHLEDRTIQWIQRSIAVILMVALAWACRGRDIPTHPSAAAAEWGMLGTVTLALSGYTWTGHFCILILGLVALFAYLAQPCRNGGNRTAWILMIAGSCLLALTSDILTPAGREWSLSLGLPLVGALLVGAALVFVRERQRRVESPTSADTPVHDAARLSSGGGQR